MTPAVPREQLAGIIGYEPYDMSVSAAEALRNSCPEASVSRTTRPPPKGDVPRQSDICMEFFLREGYLKEEVIDDKGRFKKPAMAAMPFIASEGETFYEPSSEYFPSHRSYKALVEKVKASRQKQVRQELLQGGLARRENLRLDIPIFTVSTSHHIILFTKSIFFVGKTESHSFALLYRSTPTIPQTQGKELVGKLSFD